MRKLVFSGCSITAGNGWLDSSSEKSGLVSCSDSPYLWTNLCHDRINEFKDLSVVNVAQGGLSNSDIFEKTVDACSIHGSDIDMLLCQWTSAPRYSFNAGFELWDTSEHFFNDGRTHDVNLNNGTIWSRKYVRDLIDRIRVLHHLHWEILKVVKYTNILIKIAKKIGIKNIFFINGICPWDKNYFSELNNVKPESYTLFTKKEILNIESRSDEDIYKLYHLAHKHYQDAGGITESHWINLYDSFISNRIDFNFDNNHPGKLSNHRYFEIVRDRLKQLHIIN